MYFVLLVLYSPGSTAALLNISTGIVIELFSIIIPVISTIGTSSISDTLKTIQQTQY